MSQADTLEEVAVKIQAPENPKAEEIKAWKGYEKFAFRTAFLFFFLLIVPTNLEYYKGWFTTDWKHLHIRDLGKLTGSSFAPIKIQDTRPGAGDRGSLQEYNKGYFTIYAEDGNLGLASYINWAVAFLLALIGALLWTAVDRKPRNYRVLYYFLIVGVSYSMMIRLEGLTFSKVFPTQMPPLALTQLNTPFGDFVAQKLYWIQLSFVPGYETFIGLAELLIMLCLFFRPTRALGAALSLFMIGNIAIANHVYDGGIHLAAAFYALGGSFVLWAYAPPLWNLLVNEKDVTPQLYQYPFKRKGEKYFRIAFKSFIFLFFVVTSGYLHYHNYKTDSYKVPSRPGLAGSQGLYTVTAFHVNNTPVPYSPLDSVRWQDVTFEKWSTLSFTVFRKFDIHGEAGRG